MRPISILIADDSAVVRDGLRAILAAHRDLQVVGVASDGVEAVHLVKVLIPDVVLIDGQMPGMDGAEATWHIKQRSPATRVVFLTVHASHLPFAAKRG